MASAWVKAPFNPSQYFTEGGGLRCPVEGRVESPEGTQDRPVRSRDGRGSGESCGQFLGNLSKNCLTHCLRGVFCLFAVGIHSKTLKQKLKFI